MIQVYFNTLSILAMSLLSCRRADRIIDEDMSTPRVSIVIPARNEERHIGRLLDELLNLNYENFEIVVANDSSTDNTYDISTSKGVRAVDVAQKNDIMPKANACHQGFLSCSGEIIVFLDADVSVSPNFLNFIVARFDTGADCVTIQPFHKPRRLIEQLSLFFHVSSIVGSGLFSLKKFSVGLYGPCIALTRSAYEMSEGFSADSVAGSVVEDLALGEVLNEKSLTVHRTINKKILTYRMYSTLKEIFYGWKKNISAGANATPVLVLISLVCFYGAVIGSFSSLIFSPSIIGFSFFIISWSLLLFVALRIGKYLFGIVLFPVAFAFFLVVFIAASMDKILNRDIKWKDRTLKREHGV